MGVLGRAKVNTCMCSYSVAMSVIGVVWRDKKGTSNDEPTIEEPAESDAADEITTMDSSVYDGVPVMTNNKFGLLVIWTGDVVMDAFLDCGMHMIFHLRRMMIL
jgi:hypothetical protein